MYCYLVLKPLDRLHVICPKQPVRSTEYIFCESRKHLHHMKFSDVSDRCLLLSSRVWTEFDRIKWVSILTSEPGMVYCNRWHRNFVFPYSTASLVSSFNPFSKSKFTSLYILLTLSTQNKLFGNENKANDHTQQLFQNGKTKFSQPIYKETIETVYNKIAAVFFLKKNTTSAAKIV